LRPKLDNIGWWIGGAVAIWFVAVLLQGLASQQSFYIVPADFSISGQFGDSFGSLSALMASAAAIGAWKAVSLQNEANIELKKRERELRIESKLRDFDATFFQLFGVFERLVTNLDLAVEKRYFFSKAREAKGKDIFELIVETLDQKIDRENLSQQEAYESTFTIFENDLAHYLRVVFNLIKRVEEEFDKFKLDKDFSDFTDLDERAYGYVRLIRAPLSEYELIVVAMNGLHHPQGKRHFYPLIEKFALLNNLSEGARLQYGFVEAYNETAFKSEMARPS